MNNFIVGGLAGGIAGAVAYLKTEDETFYFDLVHWTTLIPLAALAVALFADAPESWVHLAGGATLGWAAGAYLTSALPFV